MKDKTYQDQLFYEKFSAFPRSVIKMKEQTLGEHSKVTLPAFKNKKVLDIGCGFGWHAEDALKRGASYVLGIDVYEEMLAIAREKHPSEKAEFRLMSVEKMDFPENSFDLALSSLVFHYTRDLETLIRKVHHALKPGGEFICSLERHLLTFYGVDTWFYRGNRDNVLITEGEVYEQLKKATRRLSGRPWPRVIFNKSMDLLIHYGFTIEDYKAIELPDALLATHEGIREEEYEELLVYVVSARKNRK